MDASIRIRQSTSNQYFSLTHVRYLPIFYANYHCYLMRLLGEALLSHIVLLLLDFDHFEIFFTDSAFWTRPIIGYVVPASAGRNAVIRET